MRCELGQRERKPAVLCAAEYEDAVAAPCSAVEKPTVFQDPTVTEAPTESLGGPPACLCGRASDLENGRLDTGP